MKKLSRRRFIKLGLITSIGVFLVDSIWYEKFVIDWNSFDISHRQNNKIRIIQISDLHLKNLGYHHRSIANKINRKRPDIVVLTGDSVDANDKLPVLDELLGLLDMDIQKFAITGNWEYWGNVDLAELRRIYKQHNCELLINKTRLVNLKSRVISIIGVDDFIGGNYDFDEATENIVPQEFNLVLSHCPQHRDIIKEKNSNFPVDLVLSGHTHGGQINILGLVPFKPRGSGTYLKGWYEKDGPRMYVSKGVGTSILPIRFGARAEIVEFLI